MASTASERKEIYWLRKKQESTEGKGASWKTIHDLFPHIKRNELRKIYTREKRKREKAGETRELPTYQIEGAKVGEEEFDEEELWKQATAISRRRKEHNGKKIEKEMIFSNGPVCLVWMADLHLGSTSVDYDRLDRDLNTIVNTDGMYVCLVGDMLNNFIVGNLMRVRHGAEFAVSQEWVLVKRVLRLLAPKLLLSVAGNHDLWTFSLTGIDYLEEVHKTLNPDILYAKYDNRIGLRVGKQVKKIRARHKWKGYSQYNPTHGIEWAAKFDKGRDFDIAIAAHTHASGLYRQFNNGGKTGHGILCGSYVFDDDYANMLGLPEPNESAAVALVVDDHAVFGMNNLQSAADYMKAVYSSSS